MEWLKALFGATEDGQPESLTFEQLSTKITAQGDKLQIVNLKDGGYVAKEKLDAKITELKGVQQQLTDANATIQSYKDMDVDGIKRSVDDWKTKYDEDTRALQTQLEEQERTHQRDMYFAGIEFSSKAAKVGVMSEFDRQNFQLKDGVFVGADAWIEQQRTADPESFAKKEEPNTEAQQNQGNQNMPNFASSTSNGSGQNQTQQQNASKFNFGFAGVRKHE